MPVTDKLFLMYPFCTIAVLVDIVLFIDKLFVIYPFWIVINDAFIPVDERLVVVAVFVIVIPSLLIASELFDSNARKYMDDAAKSL